MAQEIMNILLSAVGVIITGLATFAVTKFTQWINTKINDAKAANYINTIMEIVLNSVKEIFQTYVEAIKLQGKFDKEAQEKALEMCLTKIKSVLAPEILDYITENFGDIDDYLKMLIESTIYNLKK